MMHDAPDDLEVPVVQSTHRLQTALVVLLLLSTLATVVLGLIVVTANDPFDPLHYELQLVEELRDDGVTVVPLVAGFEGEPAILSGDNVPIHAFYQVEADSPVEVRGSVIWASVDPRGSRCVGVFADGAPITNVPGTLRPGEYNERFSNAMPQCVVDAVTLTGPALWQIRGDVQVLAPNGVDATWETESFWVVPK